MPTKTARTAAQKRQTKTVRTAAKKRQKRRAPTKAPSSLEQKLLAERARIQRERSRIRQRTAQRQSSAPTEESAGLDEDMAELATTLMDKEVNLSIDQDLGDMVTSIDGALDKIRKSTYGRCDICGKRISKARLEAIPYATLCIECQSLTEMM